MKNPPTLEEKVGEKCTCRKVAARPEPHRGRANEAGQRRACALAAPLLLVFRPVVAGLAATLPTQSSWERSQANVGTFSTYVHFEGG